jgi:hypothetical protein
MSLEELIKRLETATGPDRELDTAIAQASCLWLTPEEEVPAYTSRTDEALWLLPRGYILESLSDEATGRTGDLKVIGACAEVSNGAASFQGQAPTRPRAVCIASLKARVGAADGGR